MMRALVALLLAAALLAGCTDAPAASGGLDPASAPPAAGPAPGDDAPTPASPSPTPSHGGRETSPAGRANNSSTSQPPQPGSTAQPAPPPASAARQWPELASAKVRPGVQTFYGGNQCTSNFVYTSPDNETVYLGSAAHCFGPGAKLGDPVGIQGGATGVLAYSSWLTMASDGGDPTTGANPTCEKEPERAICVYNDFALIRLDDASEGLVHPAMRHYGGPTALAASPEAQVGDKVLTYGHSGLRMGLDASNRHEGYVIGKPHAWSTTTYTATQGVPGDSGSGVLLGDGRALGILVTVTLYPTTGSNGVTSLDLALQYAREKAGVDARLATWELLTPGVLPA